MSIFNLFRRKPEPEMSEKRKAIIEKSGSSEKKEWRIMWIIVLSLLIVSVFFADDLETYFPNINALALIYSLPMAFFVGKVCHHLLVKGMKSVEHATEAADYLDKGSVDVPERSDTFIVYKKYEKGKVYDTSYDPNEGDF